MVNFRRLLLVVGLLAMVASLAPAQNNPVNCSFGLVQTFVRPEGITEYIGPQTFNCNTAPTTWPDAAGATTFSLTVYSSVALTSDPGSTTAPTANSEVTLTASDGVPAHTKTVTASSVTGAAAQFPSLDISGFSGEAFNVVISGLRVNASTLPGAGLGGSVSLTVIAIPGQSANVGPQSFFNVNGAPSAVDSLSNVAYALGTSSLGVSVTGAPDTLTQCNIAGNAAPTGAALTATSISVVYTPAYNATFAADAINGNIPRIVFWITGLPANVDAYVNNLVAGATLVTGTNADGSGGTLATAGITKIDGVNVVYQISGAEAGTKNPVTIPVQFAYNGTPALSSSGTTVTGGFAPWSTVTTPSHSAPIPRFVAPSYTSGNLLVINPCITNLLFTFISSAGGYDTGLAISNTGMDNLGAKNASSVNGAAGTCTWNFYGTGAPAAAVVSSSVAPGTTGTWLASGIAPGFTGYAIATCDFNYAHGYAYVVNGVTKAAQSYLPLVLSRAGVVPAETRARGTLEF